MKTKTIVHWVVQVFDKDRKPPLPFQNRHLVLDWTKVPPDDKRHILAIVDEKRRRRQRQPALSSPTATLLTMEVAPAPSVDHLMLPYRRYFVERSVQELTSDFEDASADLIRTESINVSMEYIEDRHGQRIAKQEVFDTLAGGPVVIMDDVDSVMRVGFAVPTDPQAWSSRDSNTVAQFLRVVAEIAKSEWSRAPISISWLSEGTDARSILQRVFPTGGEVASVIAWVRQLYASDDLFNHACNLYLRQVRTGTKHHWLRHVRTRFNDLREAHHRFPNIPEVTRRELIDAFAYGARILHGESQCDSEGLINKLIMGHGREQLLMAFNGSMHDLVSRANLAYHLLKQDFEHWVSTGLIPSPTAPDLNELMNSDRK